jgi:GntR family transcriptional repressor for pyruvate dehydrogenase complex
VGEELFRKFSRDRLYEQIASHIEELISSGTLQLGDQLPSEREFADGLGVGRGVVREAVKLLAERGLVTILPGRGTFVAELDTNVISDQLGRFFKVGFYSHGDLNEARSTLEVEIAGLAAQRARAEDLEEMGQALEEMDRHITSPDEYIEADLAFHSALAKATRNEIFCLLERLIADLLRESRRMIYRVPGAAERGQNWHRLIYKAVEGADGAAAREAMRKHMQQVTEDAKVGELAA